ncbi:MAG: FHA domain-containing protein [Bifidobacterium sp.]|nr:FHA domain-containing protein [Bifidobacterium sp.]
MSEQRWIVKGNGTQAEVYAGRSVEIGRKPIRVLADDGFARVEIEDKSRSMSKRHAVLSVDANGSAVLRDLNSTNGTYVVRADGTLTRVEGGVDFPLPASPVRMQFGDVPVDFIWVEGIAEAEKTPEPQVEDLFAHAASKARHKSQTASMSVDDILNLRAGEPTTALPASTVAAKVNDRKASQARSFPPAQEAADSGEDSGEQAGPDGAEVVSSDIDIVPGDDSRDNVTAAADTRGDAPETGDESAADGHAGAHDGGEPADSERIDGNQGTDVQSGDAGKNDELESSRGSSRTDVAGDDLPMAQHVVERMSINILRPGQQAGAPRDLFVDALAHSDELAHSDGQEQPDEVAKSYADSDNDSRSDLNRDHFNANQQVHASSDGAIEIREVFGSKVSRSHTLPLSVSGEEADGSSEGESRNREAGNGSATQSGSADGNQGPANSAGDASAPADSFRNDEHADETAVFKPVFEPGSVFERVSRGDFGRREPEVEIDGITSDEARRTTDFTRQFEMARRPQLLPFLAMNPSLYDDLYAWLSALGDKDIDAALSRNSGYEEYRTAVGK